MFNKFILILVAILLKFGFPAVELSYDSFLDTEGTSLGLFDDRICVIVKTRGVDIGGRVRCYGHTHSKSLFEPPSDIFVQIKGTNMFYCGITIEQKLSCWGRHIERDVSGLFNQLTASHDALCGLTVDGSVFCMGGMNFQRTYDEVILIQISCADYHCCGLDSYGHVHCWGDESVAHSSLKSPTVAVGVDGRDDEEDEEEEEEEEEEEDGYEDGNKNKNVEKIAFVQISVAMGYSCGIRESDKAIVCWGDHSHRIKMKDIVPGPFRQVSTGSLGVCGILASNDSLSCFGRASTIVRGENDVFVPFGEFDQVQVGKHSVCAVSMDSELKCWGPMSLLEHIPHDIEVA